MLRFAGRSGERDVLVTGVGAVTPAGLTSTACFHAVRQGQSVARALTPAEIDHWTELGQVPGLRRAGCVVDHAIVLRRLTSLWPTLGAADPEVLASADEPMVALALLALSEALQSAGLTATPRQCDLDRQRTAVVFGSSKGGLRTAERLISQQRANLVPVFSAGAPAAVDSAVLPWQSPQTVADAGEVERLWRQQAGTDAATVAIAGVLSAEATVQCPVAACATGLISVLQGAALISSGQCDVCVVGSADAALRASVLSSFHRLGVLSRQSGQDRACRPFDAQRDGFVVGEGAGVLILESRQHARQRGVAGLCRVLGGGWLSDPTGLTQMDETGAVVEQLLRRCCEVNALQPQILGLHGTATETNDLVESRGVVRAGLADVAECFATKGVTGHLLGAAGAVETILAVRGIAAGARPGTANLERQDERCQIRLAREYGAVSPRAVWGKLSLGFGGHVACGLFVKDAVR